MARILVVDDDPNSGTFLRLLLTDEGHDVRAVVSARDAIAAADSFAPEFLLADWQLNDGSDGLALARALSRSRPQLRVVFITGMSTTDIEPQTRALAGAVVFEKPLDLERLLGFVNSHAAPPLPRSFRDDRNHATHAFE